MDEDDTPIGSPNTCGNEIVKQEQDPEIAKKETEKRLAEFTEDLEKAKEKIAYKQTWS